VTRTYCRTAVQPA